MILLPFEYALSKTLSFADWTFISTQKVLKVRRWGTSVPYWAVWQANVRPIASCTLWVCCLNASWQPCHTVKVNVIPMVLSFVSNRGVRLWAELRPPGSPAGRVWAAEERAWGRVGGSPSPEGAATEGRGRGRHRQTACRDGSPPKPCPTLQPRYRQAKWQAAYGCWITTLLWSSSSKSAPMSVRFGAMVASV